MSTPPVPLPAEHIPPGTADWRSSDARRWLAAVPAAWAHPLWAVLALVATGFWYVAASPTAPCTSAEPCGTDWLGLGFAVVLLLTLYWVARQPRLALAGLGLVVAGHLLDGGFAVALEEPSWLGFIVAAAFAAAGMVHRLAVAGRQRALARAAAGPVAHQVPAAALTFQRGRASFVLAAPLLAVAAFGYWQAQQIADAYEERAAGLTPVSGTVTKVDDEEYRLTVTVGERGYEVETAFPEDFPVDSTVDLLVDGDWVRLPAEPYDVFGWELLVASGLVVGLAFLANGADGRTRCRRLRRGPLPVLRVLVREGHDDGKTWVYAADDLTGERPLLHFHSLFAFEEEDKRGHEDDAHDEDDAYVDEEIVEELRKVGAILKREDPPPPLREAVLYGLPYVGTELAFVAREDEDSGEVTVECSVTAVKAAVPGLTGTARQPHTPRPVEQQRRRRPVDQVAASMAPSLAPRVWAAHGVSRALGVFLLVVQGSGVWAVLDGDMSWSSLLAPIGLYLLVTSASTALNWRLTADRDGLWVAGPWRVRHVPWDQVTDVRCSASDIVVGRSQHSTDSTDSQDSQDSQDSPDARASELRLSPTGWAWLERRLGHGEAYCVRAADEARALLHRPELRPREKAAPRQQGMPVGPLIVVFSVLWGAAVLLL
ncbi:hypothetical protein [Streptomyces sp. TRM49041]|uniref:hypothetical protein n=1 Tax=Streptomyces sp. TRM49041 TaxID=2603216 RepID=UPI0021CD1573|nr:hypothetical protein [Streptomyces sp. TRM49041]